MNLCSGGANIDPVCSIWNVDELERMEYSKGDLVRAGRMLAGDMPDDPELYDGYHKTFRIAHGWRSSHIKPMSRIRASLTSKLNKSGFTSARLKRMTSIRRKLSGTTIKLTQMQDLGGCRAIMDDISDVKRIVDEYRNGRRLIRQDTSYIDKPVKSGYRGHHFIFDTEGQDGHTRRIEMQLRTRLQHSWATAVEAVGMIRKEELKSGEGNKDWLRLFSLMSCVFADIEGCQKIPGTPKSITRRCEKISLLAEKLDAIKLMEQMSTAFDLTKDMTGNQDAACFLVRYDASKQKTSVESYSRYASGAASYFGMEEVASHDTNTVLVEVDKLQNLLEAYPNYFLDVRDFVKRLKAVVR